MKLIWFLLQVLNFCCKEVPLFKNLTHLTIETDEDVGWESLPNLLENCPNLETIIFKVPSHILFLHQLPHYFQTHVNSENPFPLLYFRDFITEIQINVGMRDTASKTQ